MRDAQGPKSWKFSLYCEHEKKKNSAKTYDNDLTRTINSYEADPSSSHEFENFFFQKDLCIKLGYLIAITRTYII